MCSSYLSAVFFLKIDFISAFIRTSLILVQIENSFLYKFYFEQGLGSSRSNSLSLYAITFETSDVHHKTSKNITWLSLNADAAAYNYQ